MTRSDRSAGKAGCRVNTKSGSKMNRRLTTPVGMS